MYINKGLTQEEHQELMDAFKEDMSERQRALLIKHLTYLASVETELLILRRLRKYGGDGDGQKSTTSKR